MCPTDCSAESVWNRMSHDEAAPSEAILSPTQQRVADDLLGLGLQRPMADLSWGPELRTWIDDALAEHVPREQLWVSKGSLSGVLACETAYLATKDFEWRVEIASGVIVHHAIALAASGAEAPPLDLAYASINQAKNAGGGSLGAWLRDLDEEQRTALVAQAVVGIDGFLSAFPPIRASWHPVAEFPVSMTVAAGKVRVSGRVDLALGSLRAGSDHVLRRRRLLLEIKTGRPRPEHRADHLLYALLETLRSGVAPWKAATFYTGEQSWIADEITLDLLFVAARRLVAGTKRIIELGEGRESQRQPGWRCSFCSLATTCQAHLDAENLARVSNARG